MKAALGVKIFAPGLEKAIAGARLYVAENEDEESYFSDICMDDLQTLKRFAVGQKGKGVYVQASTLGALEALLTFLQSNKVPIHDFGVGPVFAKTIRTHVPMAERAPEYACVLAFDVSIEPDAKALAAKEGLKIFDGMCNPPFIVARSYSPSSPRTPPLPDKIQLYSLFHNQHSAPGDGDYYSSWYSVCHEKWWMGVSCPLTGIRA